MRQIGVKIVKALPHLVPGFILALSIILIWYFLPMDGEKEKYVPLATFGVLAITLAALVYYAYDTRRIANVTQKKWELEIQPRGSYDVKKVQNGKVFFEVINLSGFMLYAKVQCNFRIYDDSVKGPEGFDGTVWRIFPYRTSWSYFDIEPLLSIKGKTIDNMRSERKPENRQTQLTMDVEIEFKNDLGRPYPLPSEHYFLTLDSERGFPM